MLAQTPAWDRVKDYAAKFEEIIDAPVDDTAAIIGVDTAWLGAFLLGLKFLASGFAIAFRERKR